MVDFLNWWRYPDSNRGLRGANAVFSQLYYTPNLERVARIELANNPWQGFRLPLHHTRVNLFISTSGAP